MAAKMQATMMPAVAGCDMLNDQRYECVETALMLD